MKCEKVNIEIFMQAWFNHDFTNITKEDFDIVYSEYIDLTGLYNSKEFELFAYINYLKNRIYTAKTLVWAQLIFLEQFKVPYIDGFEVFERIGHKVSWNDDEKKFIAQMNRISSMTRAKELELRRKEFEFMQLRNAKKEDKPEIQSRHDFIRMLNSFNKEGYRIDRKKTTVEELALMIKQVQDETTKLAAERIKTK